MVRGLLPIPIKWSGTLALPKYHAIIKADHEPGRGGSGVRKKVPPLEMQLGRVEQALLKGMSNSEIAGELGVKVRTVKAYLARMFRMYDVKGGIPRVKLAVLLYREQLKREVQDEKDKVEVLVVDNADGCVGDLPSSRSATHC